MSVDPSNPDIVYVSNATGIFFVSYNAGVTWRIINTMLAAWPHATATNNIPSATSSPTVTFSATPAEVLSWNSNQQGLVLFGYNAGGGGGPDGLGPLSLGSNGANYDSGGVNSTQFGFTYCPPRDGASSSQGVLIGDVIYMGCGGLVAIDAGQGTVTNPGIGLGDPGSQGSASKNVMFGSLHPAFLGGVWLTTDGNPENATLTTGGPDHIGSPKSFQ